MVFSFQNCSDLMLEKNVLPKFKKNQSGGTLMTLQISEWIDINAALSRFRLMHF